MKSFALFAGALLLEAACACTPQTAAPESPAADASPARDPDSGLALIPLSVMTANGPHRFTVEVAQTMPEQAKGLMFRTSLAPDRGMIFPNDPPEARSFWMKNTVIPLDIIFIGPDKRILNIAHGTPYSLEPLPSAGPSINVLEIAAGRAAELGIKPGDPVEW